ncbi:MAG: amidohydrolase family protein [Gemmatimonadota bacterium]
MTTTVPATPAAAQSADQLSADTRQYVSVSSPVVALVGVTVIDGTGADAVADQTVVLRDGRIAAVGASGDVDIPEGADVHELPGHTVIPGMVGMHDHLFYAGGGRRAQLQFSAPRLYLGAGVTTIRTTGSQAPYSDLSMKAAIDVGQAVGPRIHVTAPYITGPAAGVTYMATVADEEEARRFVGYWADEGATWIKAYTNISRAALGAAIEEAHARGLRVTGHICSVTFEEAVDLGIDNIEHGFLTASDFIEGKQPDQCPSNSMISIGSRGDATGERAQNLIRKMVDNGVSMTSTLAVIEPFFPDRPEVMDQRTLDLLADEIRDAYVQFREQVEANANWPFTPGMFQKAMEFEKAFFDAGGVLAGGVDPTGTGGVIHGFGDQRNYELLIEAGLSPVQAVRAMSLNGALILGEEGDIGSVEAGKLADVLVLEGDLSGDASVIRNVRIVFKHGVGFDPTKLIESTKGRVGVS